MKLKNILKQRNKTEKMKVKKTFFSYVRDKISIFIFLYIFIYFTLLF